jgi:chromate reductase
MDSHRPLKVLVIGASLRSASLNNQLAQLAGGMLTAAGVAVTMHTLNDFPAPLYDQDVEDVDGIPSSMQELAALLKDADGFVIASPEYNASLPGGLKNTIDWLSRVRPRVFDGSHGFLVSASESRSGGNPGLWALRVPLESLGATIQPTMFSASVRSTSTGGQLLTTSQRERLQQSLVAFVKAIEAVVAFERFGAAGKASDECLVTC